MSEPVHVVSFGGDVIVDAAEWERATAAGAAGQVIADHLDGTLTVRLPPTGLPPAQEPAEDTLAADAIAMLRLHEWSGMIDEEPVCLECGGVPPDAKGRDDGIPPLSIQPSGCFRTFDEWVNKAKSWIGGMNAACFDSKGRLCARGRDFMRARDEGTFPVWYVFPIEYADEAPTAATKPKRRPRQRHKTVTERDEFGVTTYRVPVESSKAS